MLKKILFVSLVVVFAAFADLAVSTAAQDQAEVSAAGMSSRSFVAWTDSRAGTGNTNIYGNIIGPSGTLLTTDQPICVSAGLQYDVATCPGQKFMVFWVDERTTDAWELWGQHVNSDATLSGSNFQVTSNTTQKAKPSADRLGNDILVVFEEFATNRTIRGQRLTWGTTSYAPSGSVFSISDGTSAAYWPAVCAGSTDFLVAWTNTTTKSVYARRVSATGTPLGTAQVVADYSSGAYSPSHASVAWDGTKWLVVWDIYVFGADMNVCGRFVDATGTPSGTTLNIASATQAETYPSVAFDGIGFLVVFQDTRSVYANIYGRRVVGGTVGAEVPISSGSYNQNKPSVCWNGTYHDVFWQDYRGTYNWDVYTNRIEQTPWNGPTASPLTPPDLGGSSCARQEAVMELYDSDGINTSTIQFSANGVNYTIASPQLSYASNRLTFTPSADWPQNVWIECCLNAVQDMTGLGILNPICWSFMVDRTNPVFGTANPANGDSAGAGAVPISIGVTDAGCGVSTTNMAFQVEGVWYVYGSSPAVSWDGTKMNFTPSAIGLSFEPFETINVCARVRDRAEYCTANEVTTCWLFYTSGTKIYGTVHLSGATNHSGVTVEARYGDSLWTATTNTSGSYSIPGVMEVAGITVTAYKAGYSDSTVTVNMAGGGFGLANFTLYPVITMYESDFEANNGGLTLRTFSYYNDWEWGVPTSGPGSAHSGTKCWATRLNADYHDSSQSRLILASISLPAGTAPKLHWWQWYRFQAPTYGGTPRRWQWHDGGNVKLFRTLTDSVLLVPDKNYDTTMSTSNLFIRNQRAYADNDNGNFWHRVSVDLSAWAGQTVSIIWDFGSSSVNRESGWFIDDVVIGYTDFTGIEGYVDLPRTREILVQPNPFNSSCAITAVGDVQIFDISGRQVQILVSPDSKLVCRMVWDGKNTEGDLLPSGVYFAKIKDSDSAPVKMVFMK